MSNQATSRFNRRKKANKKPKVVEEPVIVPVEVSVPGFGEYHVIEDDKNHRSTDITYLQDQKFVYHHRGSLVSVITYYKIILNHSPRVQYIIEKAGWKSFLTMDIGESCHPLVDYLAERFWDTTNTFHFPFGEMGFTPLDWVMLTGLSIGVGDDVPYEPQNYKFDLVRQNFFPEMKDPLVLKREEKGQEWVSDAITVTFLCSYFNVDTLVAANDDNILAERVARAFFMYVLGQFFFSSGKNYIDAGWLAAFEDLNAVGTYDWGGAAFSKLLSALGASGRGQKTLAGPFQILEFWGYEYLGICRPDIKKGNEHKLPRSTVWRGKKKSIDIVRARSQLNQLTIDQVTWQPWDSFRNVLDTNEGRQASVLSDSTVIFSRNGIHELYLGERCWRQNHMNFAIPVNPPLNMRSFTDNDAKEYKEGGVFDATTRVKVVPYDIYLQYWQKVTNLQNYVTNPDWNVDAYGYVADIHTHKLQQPAEHVPIPPQHQLSHAEAYGFFQQQADFNQQLREFILDQTKDRSDVNGRNFNQQLREFFVVAFLEPLPYFFKLFLFLKTNLVPALIKYN